MCGLVDLTLKWTTKVAGFTWVSWAGILVRINTRPVIGVGSRLGVLDRCLPFNAEVKSDVDLMNPLRLLSSRDRQSPESLSSYFHFTLVPLAGAGQSRRINQSGCNCDVKATDLWSRADGTCPHGLTQLCKDIKMDFYMTKMMQSNTLVWTLVNHNL